MNITTSLYKNEFKFEINYYPDQTYITKNKKNSEIHGLQIPKKSDLTWNKPAFFTFHSFILIINSHNKVDLEINLGQ